MILVAVMTIPPAAGIALAVNHAWGISDPDNLCQAAGLGWVEFYNADGMLLRRECDRIKKPVG